MNQIKELIEQYQQIALYRHVNPDLDAFGSQFGLYWTLKELYPQKTFLIYGEETSDLLRLYPSYEKAEKQDMPTLGIVLDTANKERIDGDISLCEKIMKIDHHIVVESYGDVNLEKPEASSCSEVVTLWLKENGMRIPARGAQAFYLGIIGDSNRFLYSSTSASTFEAAAYLLESGIDIEKLYQSLYLRKKSDLEVTKFIYNHYQEDENIAWYYLSDEDLKTLNISRNKGSQYVNTLANIEEYRVWMAITENKEENNYRVSIRSREVTINEVAAMFRGGGHACASGATLESLDELPLLIQKLKEKINE